MKKEDKRGQLQLATNQDENRNPHPQNIVGGAHTRGFLTEAHNIKLERRVRT